MHVITKLMRWSRLDGLRDSRYGTGCRSLFWCKESRPCLSTPNTASDARAPRVAADAAGVKKCR